MSKDTYYAPTTMQVGKVSVTVHSPILTDEERNKRIEILKKAIVQMFSNK